MRGTLYHSRIARGIMATMDSKKRPHKGLVPEALSPAERRAARAENIRVVEAEPYGWIAHSATDSHRRYHLFRDPESRQLACTCADFSFRGNAEPGYECKHVSAVLKFIGRRYLATEYDPHRQRFRAA
jgi:hypothetical protein